MSAHLLLNQLGTVIAAAHEATPEGQSTIWSFLPLILIFAGFWFLMIVPQRKKQKQHDQLINGLKSGDEVLTAGGIFGTITNVKDDRFVLKVSDNTKIEVLKSCVQTRIDKDKEVKKA